MPKTSKRVALLDELRGFFIILMVFYHGFYNLVEIFGLDIPFFYSTPMRFLQLLIAGDFIFISGAVSRYTRSNRKRGLQVFLCGMILTLVTLFVPGQTIYFGVLHLLGFSMVFFHYTQKLLDKLHPTLGLLLCTAVFLGTYFVSSGVIGFPPFTAALPSALYSTNVLFWLGLPGPGFYSADYFSVFPWLFFFLAGSYCGVFLKAGRFPNWVYRPHLPALAKVGRHTLIIYLLHQPVLYGTMSVLFHFLNR